MSPHEALRDILLAYAGIADDIGSMVLFSHDNVPDPGVEDMRPCIVVMDENRVCGPAEFGCDWLFRYAENRNAVWAVWENLPDIRQAAALGMMSAMTGRPLVVIVTDAACGPKWIDLVRPIVVVRHGASGWLHHRRETRQ